MSTFNAVIITEIRTILARSGITQAVLARKCGWTPTAFSRRMTGDVPFSTTEIDAIAVALDVTIEQLLWPSARTQMGAPTADGDALAAGAPAAALPA